MRCTECGGADVEWTCTQVPRSSGVPDGRLRMHDVHTAFVLGCNECSETVRVVTGDEIARWMTAEKSCP